jgi:hypothetical protein
MTDLQSALAAFDAADVNNRVEEESTLFAECLAAGWPGLDASHVQWARDHVGAGATSYSTIQEAAAALFAAFVSAKRDNGDTFYKLADGSPEWMTDAIHAAHGDMMPDDWRYACIRSVASAVSEVADDEDMDDARHEAVDSAVDVYNARLAAWLGSHSARLGYCDEAIEEGMCDPTRGVSAILQAGQYAEIDEVWGQLVAALEGEVSE